MEKAEARELTKAVEANTRELRDIKRAIESLAKVKKSEPDPIKIFEGPKPLHPIHLAFMDPNNPRPTCWNHSALGAKFTITSHESDVTCLKCVEIIEQNQ